MFRRKQPTPVQPKMPKVQSVHGAHCICHCCKRPSGAPR